MRTRTVDGRIFVTCPQCKGSGKSGKLFNIPGMPPDKHLRGKCQFCEGRGKVEEITFEQHLEEKRKKLDIIVPKTSDAKTEESPSRSDDDDDEPEITTVETSE